MPNALWDMRKWSIGTHLHSYTHNNCKILLTSLLTWNHIDCVKFLYLTKNCKIIIGTEIQEKEKKNYLSYLIYVKNNWSIGDLIAKYPAVLILDLLIKNTQLDQNFHSPDLFIFSKLNTNLTHFFFFFFPRKCFGKMDLELKALTNFLIKENLKSDSS